MLKLRGVEKFALGVQILYDLRIRLFHKDTAIGGLGCQFPLAVHELYKGQIVLAAHIGIVLTESGSNVYDTGAVRHSDIVVTGHEKSLLALFFRRLSSAGKQRLIFFMLQFSAHISLQQFVGRTIFGGQFSQYRIQQGLRHIIGMAVRRLHPAVSLLRVHAQGHIGGQRPGRGGPCQEISVLPGYLKANHGGAFFHQLIALGHFLGGQGGTAAGAVGNDLKAFIQKSLVPDLFQRPPLGLDKIIVISHIRIVHVGPEAHCAGEILPHALVFPDALLAFVDKGFQAVGFDLILAVQPQQFFHLDLHRQAMGIPSCLAGHHIALHGAVTGDHVLDNPGLHMADVGLAVGRRRPVIKSIGLPVFVFLQAFAEDIMFLPEPLHLLLPVHKIKICRYFLIHSALLLLL